MSRLRGKAMPSDYILGKIHRSWHVPKLGIGSIPAGLVDSHFPIEVSQLCSVDQFARHRESSILC